jgi:hypothetical protein
MLIPALSVLTPTLPPAALRLITAVATLLTALPALTSALFRTALGPTPSALIFLVVLVPAALTLAALLLVRVAVTLVLLTH